MLHLLMYFQVFILIPIIFVLVSMYLVIGPIIEDPKIELLYAFLFIVGGLVFYFPLVVFKLDRGCFGRYHIKQDNTNHYN